MDIILFWLCLVVGSGERPIVNESGRPEAGPGNYQPQCDVEGSQVRFQR